MRKNWINKLITTVTVAGLSVGVLIGCGKSEATDNSVKEDTTDQVTVIHVGEANEYYIPCAVASKLGYFEEELPGVEVEFVSGFQNGPALIEATTAGELDIIVLADQPVLAGKANSGLDIKIIANIADGSKNLILVANPDAGIKTAADLKDKNIAVGFATGSHKALLKYLESGGLTDTDVNLINMSKTDEVLAAYERGEIDVASVSITNYQRFLDAGAEYLTNSVGYARNSVLLAGRNEWMKENPNITAGFIRAIDRAVTYIQENPDDAVKLKAESIDGSETTLQYEKNHILGFDYAISFNQEDFDNYQSTAQFGYDNGSFSTLVDVKDVIDESYYHLAGLK